MLLVFQSIIFDLKAVIIELQKELNHSRKGLINIQNIDHKECFNWCLVKYISSVDPNPK